MIFSKDLPKETSRQSIAASGDRFTSLRVLQIGQDDLFGSLPNVDCEFISTGHSITPGADDRQTPKLLAFRRIFSLLTRRKKWDVIVLPVVDFDWPHDSTRFKRSARYLLKTLLNNRLVTKYLNAFVQRRADQITVVDRFDATTIVRPFLKSLPCVSSYFKANLLEEQAEFEHFEDGNHACRMIHLPYWIMESRYPRFDSVKKDTDVLFVGAVNSPAREHGVQVLERLAAEGYRCVVATQRIPFDEYLQQVAGAWLTLSPEGYGYTCFRHYEAMLMESIPIINRPQSAIVNDFVDGENCLLYETTELYDLLRNALENKDRLSRISEGLRDFAFDHHSCPSVGSYILRQLGVIDEHS